MDSNKLIKKLVDYAIPDFYDSLELLFTNCDSIPRFPYGEDNNHLMIIQGVNTLTREDHEVLNMAINRWQNRIKNLRENIRELAQHEINQQLDTLPALFAHPSQLSTNFVSKEVVEAATADFIIDCISKYNVQSSMFDDPHVIRKLSKRLGILEPWSQAHLCSVCEVFEILLSTHPEKDTHCPKCDKPMKTIRVYKLNPELEQLKLSNKDLPEFVKEYLSTHLADDSIISSFQLNGQNGGDIDVYVPKTKTGIECKLFVHPKAEGNYLHSCIAELIKSFKKYIEFGNIERLIGIINLDEKYKEQVENEIKTNLTKNSLFFKDVKIICNSVSSLFVILNEEIQFYQAMRQSN